MYHIEQQCENHCKLGEKFLVFMFRNFGSNFGAIKDSDMHDAPKHFMSIDCPWLFVE